MKAENRTIVMVGTEIVDGTFNEIYSLMISNEEGGSYLSAVYNRREDDPKRLYDIQKTFAKEIASKDTQQQVNLLNGYKIQDGNVNKIEKIDGQLVIDFSRGLTKKLKELFEGIVLAVPITAGRNN